MIGLVRVCGQTAYVTNVSSNTISVINVPTNTITATISVGSNPKAVSVSADGKKVYVANYSSHNVSVINTATNTVLNTIPVSITPQGICASPDGSKVYVSHNNSTTVNVINTTTETVSDTIIGSGAEGVCFSQDGSKAYIANWSTNTVSVISTATNTVLATIAAFLYPFGVCMSPDGTKLYVTNFTGNSLSVINTVTNTHTAGIAVGIAPCGVCVSPDGSKVYVANQDSHTVSVINTATNTVTATITVGGSNSNGISISPDGTKVYVANFSSNNVSVINALTNVVSGTIVVGNNPESFGNFISIFGTINLGSIDTSVCPNSTISVPFTAWDTLNPGNIFTAQLSNASGSFASPVNIGTLADTVSGTITATIPAGTPAGTGYRIRVTSSNPAATGADNGTNITVHPLPVVTYTQSPNIYCLYDAPFSLSTASPAGGTYMCSGCTGGDTFYPAVFGLGTEIITYYYTDTNGCMASDASVITIDLCTNIQSINNEQPTIEIYPNPTTGQLTVNSEQLTIKEIKIYNILGEELIATTPNNNQSTIDITQYSKGLYFAEIKTDGSAGSPTIVRKKIIKE
jgi:hypothetical protein